MRRGFRGPIKSVDARAASGRLASTPIPDDVACLIDVAAGNSGCTTQDPDFYRDGNVDQDDVAAEINAVAGGGRP